MPNPVLLLQRYRPDSLQPLRGCAAFGPGYYLLQALPSAPPVPWRNEAVQTLLETADRVVSGNYEEKPQDTHAGTIIGTTSYGKGSVQTILPMMDDDAVKLTIAKYYTPSGRSIDGVGITPDIEVQLDENSPVDTQLNKAKEILNAVTAQ